MMILLLSIASYAADLPGEPIFRAPVSEVKTAPVSNKRPRAEVRPQESGNLPTEYLRVNRQSTASELVQPPKGSIEIFRALRVGDTLDLKVSHSIIAFADEKSPVIAVSDAGPFKGVRFIGESYLEPNTKRIFINFQRVLIGNQIYQTKAVGVSSEGQPGLFGEYHSREAEYFTGDFIASFAAGYFDGLIPRRTNAFGQIETDSSIDSAVKKGLASGALSTADRFREKLKKVPEFSELKGPIEMQVLVLDQVKN